jgi:nucleoside-diphosphate-sugar epimerase
MASAARPLRPTALVTGARGFLASELCSQLSERGFRVRGTVRSLPKNPANTTSNAATFEPIVADLLTEGSFDAAVEGCDYVFHTASPFTFGWSDAQRDLVEPALNGTKNVLNAVARNNERARQAKERQVKRVVVTSSIAAVAGIRDPGHVYDERDWNLDSALPEPGDDSNRGKIEAYRFSKRVAEEAAQALAEEFSLDVTFINPSFILGPGRLEEHAVRSQSQRTVAAFLDGSLRETGCAPTAFGCCDVGAVARAHIEAAVRDGVHGRFLVTSPTGIRHLELCRWLAEAADSGGYPSLEAVRGNLPTFQNPSIPEVAVPQYSADKCLRELGVATTEASLREATVRMACRLVQVLGLGEKSN